MADNALDIDRQINGSDDLMVSRTPSFVTSIGGTTPVTIIPFDPQVEKTWETGYVDWYDHTRSYGFVRSDLDGRQRFLHRKVVLKAWASEFSSASAPPKHIDLPENQRVKFRSSPSDRGGRDEVTELQIVRR